MKRLRWAGALALLTSVLASTLSESPSAGVIDYDIVYVRAPRFGDNPTRWTEVTNPAAVDPGGDLVLLHPNGSEEVLVAGGNGAVTDPFISFDAKWCYYAYASDVRTSALVSGPHKRLMPRSGFDIYRIHLETRAIERLTFQEFTPNTAAGTWDVTPVGGTSGKNALGYGVLNLSPVPIAGGRIMFTSNRNGFIPPKSFSAPTLQLFVMDEDGENVTPIAPMTIGSALHPVPLADGRVMFSSFESQGIRDDILWGIWSIDPDGRRWQPLVSAYFSTFHFQTQLTNRDVVVENYYNLNNNGFGAYYRFPAPDTAAPAFHGAPQNENPPLEFSWSSTSRDTFRMPFTPRGFTSLTPMTLPWDNAAPAEPGGTRRGKFTHPQGAPGGDLLTVWTPGPAIAIARPVSTPFFDGGIYLIRGGRVVNSPSDFIVIKNDPRYNEIWPRPVVRYRDIYGIDEPPELPWLPNDGTAHPALPPGTPYGIVGTSSFYKRESAPGTFGNTRYGKLDVFNTAVNYQNSNWITQGADAGTYSNDDIHAVRIVTMEPNSDRAIGPNAGQHFSSHANERMRILGEIPLRKLDANGRPVLDPEGNPDTSFAARIPADLPFTFQMLDKDGLVLTSAQTWHQVRPGEARWDCGGCHAHSQTPLAFERTAAARPDYELWDLTKQTPMLAMSSHGEPTTRSLPAGAVDVEFFRDIRPILQRSCVSCHTKDRSPAPGELVLDDYTPERGLPGDYVRLANDPGAKWGHKPLIGTWRQTNASRYLRRFQSRRSLLVWKVFGRRLDGWTNADHPTERVPGDASTLPAGASANEADLDYTGTIMPPPDSGVPALTSDEKMMIARWIDLGAPIDLAATNGHRGFGWFLDENRPTLTVSSPRPNANAGPLTEIRVGVADGYSGLATESLSITATVPIGGRPAGAELAAMGRFVDDGIFSIPLVPALTSLTQAHLTVKVRDRAGNWTSQTVRFWVGPTAGPARARRSARVDAAGPALSFATAPGSNGARRIVPAPGVTALRGGGQGARTLTPPPSEGLEASGYLRDSIVVKFRAGTSAAARAAMLGLVGAGSAIREPDGDFDIVTLTGIDPEAAARRLAVQPDVLFAQARYRLRPQHVRPLPTAGSSGLRAFSDAWAALSLSGTEHVTVALIDTGVAFRDGLWRQPAGAWQLPGGVAFPALGMLDLPFAIAPTLSRPGLFVGPRDFIWGDADPMDLDGHGTYLGATIERLTRGAPGAAAIHVMPIKAMDTVWDRVLGSPVEGTDDVLARAIRYAVAQGARVINISAGRDGSPSPVVEDALRHAVSRGAFVAVAAGNRTAAGGDTALAAAAARVDGVAVVAALGADGLRAPYSAGGAGIELLAPGTSSPGLATLLSYDPDFTQTWEAGPARYAPPRFDIFAEQVRHGTSVAAAHVTALAALIMRQGPTSPARVESLLTRSALDRGVPGRDDEYGHGIVDPAAALRLAGAVR